MLLRAARGDSRGNFVDLAFVSLFFAEDTFLSRFWFPKLHGSQLTTPRRSLIDDFGD